MSWSAPNYPWPHRRLSYSHSHNTVPYVSLNLLFRTLNLAHRVFFHIILNFSASTKLLKLFYLVTHAVVFSLNMNCFPFATGSFCFSGSKKLSIGLAELQLPLERTKMYDKSIMLVFPFATIIAMTSCKGR